MAGPQDLQKLEKSLSIHKERIKELERKRDSIAKDMQAELRDYGVENFHKFGIHTGSTTTVKSIQDVSNEIILAQTLVDDTEKKKKALEEQIESLDQQRAKVMTCMTAALYVCVCVFDTFY